MSLPGVIADLGHALVSHGLGGPGDTPQETEEIVLACPIIELRGPSHLVANASVATHLSLEFRGPTHLVVEVVPRC